MRWTTCRSWNTLKRRLTPELEQARHACERSGRAGREFKDFRYRTLNSWSRERRVIGKAEHLPRGSNPRFVMTSLSARLMAASPLDEDVYCARGDMENRIKEQQLALFADRTSAQTLRAHQLRMCFSAFAYVLPEILRRWGLPGAALARARSGAIRLELLKLRVRVRVSVQAVRLSFDEGFHEAGVGQLPDMGAVTGRRSFSRGELTRIPVWACGSPRRARCGRRPGWPRRRPACGAGP